MSASVVPVENAGVVRKGGFENVKFAVKIEVADPDTHSGLFQSILADRGPPFQSFLLERAIPLIMQKVAPGRVARDVNIGPSIGIEIGGNCRQSVAVTELRDTRRFAHVLEAALAIVAIEVI